MTLLGRHALVEACLDDVAAGRSVVLEGESGLGKTALVETLAARLEDLGAPVFRVTGADGASGVALAPFAAVLSELELPSMGTLDVYARLPRELEAIEARVVVDDIDLLEPASRVLLDHIAREGVPVVAAASDLHALRGSIGDGIDAKRWGVRRLEPLDEDAIVELAARHLGADPSVPTGAALLARAHGSPRALFEVLPSCMRGSRVTPGGVVAGGSWVTARAKAAWAVRSESLPPVALAMVERLAVAGSLPLEVVPDDVLTVLRQLDLVVVGDEVALAREGLRDAVVDAMSPALTARRAGEASGVLAASTAAAADRVATLAAAAGWIVGAEDAVAAARSLVGHGSFEEALTVLDASPADDAAARLARGAALSGLDRHAEAERALAAAQRALSETPDTTGLALELCQEWGLLWAVRAGDPQRAVTSVESAAELIRSAEERAAIDGELVKWRLMAGAPGVSPAGLTPAANADLAVGMALIQAMVSSLDGPPAMALEIVEHGRAALAASSRPARHAEELLALSSFLATCFDARLAEAELAASERRRRALTSGDSAVGLWEFASAELALHSGRYEAASAFARRAMTHLHWRDFTGLRPTAIALRAAVVARRGDTAGALALVSTLPKGADADVKVELHLARVTAHRRWQSRDIAEAARVLKDAGARATAASHGHLGLMAIDEAWMLLPGARSGEAIVERASASALAEALAARVEAFAAADPDALLEAASRLASVGVMGRAVHAQELAAGLLESGGHLRDARRVRAAVRAAVAFTEVTVWPASGEEEPLTAREREIAQLAAARVRSKEIAERLGLSVRTVDNHLGRVFRKLGIQGRDELFAALEAV